MLKRLDIKVILVALAAFLIIEARATYLLFDLLELKKSTNFEVVDARQSSSLSTFEMAIEQAAAELASVATAGHRRDLFQAKAALQQARAALANLRQSARHEQLIDEVDTRWRHPLLVYRRLIALAENEYADMRQLVAKPAPAAIVASLDDLFRYERSLDKLRAALWRRREAQYIANNHDIRQLAQLAIQTRVGNSLLLLAVVCTAVFFTRRFIVKPINNLATAASAVAAGDLDQTVAITSQDEIGHLQSAFNRMVQNLKNQQSVLIEREQALRESEVRLHAAMAYGGIARWECDLLTGRIFESEQMGSMFGKPPGWVHPDYASWKSMIHPEDRDRTIAQFDAAVAGGTGYQTQYRVLWEDGVTVRWLESSVTILRDESGRAVRSIGLDRDITEHKTAEIALRESEERFRLLVEGAREYAIFMLDPKGRIETWNAGAQRLIGYTGEEIIGRHFSQFYTPEDVEAGHPQRVLESAKREGQYKEEGWRVRKDGTRFLANVVITAVHDTEGRLRGFAKITRDVTEQRANEQALQTSREALRNFAASLDANIEDERGRIAHALHDELGQNLAVMRMYLSALQRQKSGDPRVVEAVSRLEEIVANTGTAIRRIMTDLRPLVLDNFGITAAAEALIQDYVTSTSLEVDLDVSGEFDDLSAQHTTVLYRMLQECFTNVVKHAFASQVLVHLQRHDDAVVLSVSDDGLGLSQDQQAKAGSYGLFGMQERAVHYGGRLDIDSAPCTGTTLTLWLPL